jgi:hypothetical protein
MHTNTDTHTHKDKYRNTERERNNRRDTDTDTLKKHAQQMAPVGEDSKEQLTEDGPHQSSRCDGGGIRYGTGVEKTHEHKDDVDHK